MEGWIKLHRSCLEHWLYNEYRPLTKREAWETILFTVNFEDGKSLIKGQLYECKRGQSLLSLQSWADKFVWSIQQVRTFFKLLENDKMIKLEGLQYTTRLTVCNYDIYQGSLTDEQHAANTPLTDEQHAANTPLTTIKEREEIKKNKKEKNIKEFTPPIFEDVKKYFSESGYSIESAAKFFNYYREANWKDSNGNAVKNWKQKAIGVWFKDENKIKTQAPAINQTKRIILT